MWKMWNNKVFIYSVVMASISITHQQADRQYRSDYVYKRNTDAFYKLHIESASHSGAENLCGVEGAKLLTPLTDQDLVHIHATMKQYPDLDEFVWIGNDEGSHESAEEAAVIDLQSEPNDAINDAGRCDVVSRAGDEKTLPCYRRLPFICKVEGKDAYHNNQCDVFGKGPAASVKQHFGTFSGFPWAHHLSSFEFTCVHAVEGDSCVVQDQIDYELLPDVGSCYKVLKRALSWNQGYADCRAEGAHLAVINSEAERQAVWALIKRTPKVAESTADWFYHIGFRALGNATASPREFRTIFNQTLAEAGFEEWSVNEPNNSKSKEDCGCLFKNNGKFNDIDCSAIIGVICEKEMNRKN